MNFVSNLIHSPISHINFTNERIFLISAENQVTEVLLFVPLIHSPCSVTCSCRFQSDTGRVDSSWFIHVPEMKCFWDVCRPRFLSLIFGLIIRLTSASFGTEKIDPKASLVWGPAIEHSDFELPVRYFYVQLVDGGGRKYVITIL